MGEDKRCFNGSYNYCDDIIYIYLVDINDLYTCVSSSYVKYYYIKDINEQ